MAGVPLDSAVESQQNPVLIVTPLSNFEIYGYITEGLPSLGSDGQECHRSQMFAQDPEEELRAICDGLFIPQSDHGVKTRMARRRGR